MSTLRCALISALVTTTLLAQTPAVLNIDVRQQKSPVSPTLYGLMTEEINYSYDGGLYAELVRNRTFRSDWTGVLNWFVVEKGKGSAKLSADAKEGPSVALTNSGKVQVIVADANNPAGVLNEGYWGIAVRRNTRYTGSLWAKLASPDSIPARVAIVSDQSNQVLASATLTVAGTAWKEYNFEMTSGNVPESSENHLELLFEKPATVWLQMVSLFPPTYKGRANGNRADIMEKLAAMHPSFLRFPGGNHLEGNRIETRFDWKKTVGPLVDRPTHPTTWSYHSSDGMGLLEFLEWCEDLNMEPVLGVYAGYSLQVPAVKPGADLEPYMQDALDEIEYATGATSTKWGAMRAAHGHPAPFKIRYIEVGNEDNFDRSGSYDARYAQYYKAIKTKYPNMQLIATTPIKGMTPDVLDDHYYKRESEMFELATRYDKADRKGPKIFVGEWATREGAPTPNLGAALGDAAFLTGLERNSDLVIMSAYAPLFVNVDPGGMQWTTDLIGFDAATSYGSPAYYTQVMFNSCLGDHTVESSVTGASDKFFYSATASSGKLCLKLVNASSNSQTVSLNLAGMPPGGRQARVQTLSGPGLRSTNTITNPKRLIPITSSVALTGGPVSHTMPAYSIQVLEVDLK